MSKIRYIDKKFTAKTQAVIEQAESIVREYQAQGYSLTLRQLYYQFVARALIPNTDQSYNRLGVIVSDARRAGLLDWNAIEDRTRNLRKLANWDKPQEILESAKQSYHRDLWANQDYRLEVWIEKDALVGVIEQVCKDNDVPYFSCRGYVSDSEMWRCGMRIIRHENKDQKVVILHLGDHDPSGLDMTRDIEERLQMFSDYGGNVEVRRLGLSMEQIEELQPPPNPAKVTDSRYATYRMRFGEESWELDALEPSYITSLVQEAVDEYKDEDKWDEAIEEQESEREQIGDVIKRWNEITGGD